MTSSASGREPLLQVTSLETWFGPPTRRRWVGARDTTQFPVSGATPVVDGLSLTVMHGQAVGIVGESGSGKTQTILSVFGLSPGKPGVIAGHAHFKGIDLLTGLERFVSRSRAVDGTEMLRKNVPAWQATHRRTVEPLLGTDIALMFQEPRRSLVPYWTVGRHLTAVMNRRKPERRDAAELLERLGFRRPHVLLSAFPHQLSGGETQRVMLALAIAIAPLLLIADEPTSALDAVNEILVLDAIQRVREDSGAAVILISHDLAVVSAVTEYVYVIYGGRVMERAPARILAGREASPSHPYTQELLASQRRRERGVLKPPALSARIEDSPHGCRYAPQCALRPTLPMVKQNRCLTKNPEPIEVGANHVASCWEIQPP